MAGLTTILGPVYMFRTFQRTMRVNPNSLTQVFADLTVRERSHFVSRRGADRAYWVYPALAGVVRNGSE